MDTFGEYFPETFLRNIFQGHSNLEIKKKIFQMSLFGNMFSKPLVNRASSLTSSDAYTETVLTSYQGSVCSANNNATQWKSILTFQNARLNIA